MGWWGGGEGFPCPSTQNFCHRKMNVNNINGKGDQTYSNLSLDDLNLDTGLCRYYEISEFQSKVKETKNNFSIISHNVQSLRSKWNDFEEFVSEVKVNDFEFSVIGIQETWLLPPDFPTYLDGYGNIISKTRKPKNHNSNIVGGGVGVWISNEYKYEQLDNISIFQEGIFESIFIKIFTNKEKYKIVGNIYRPPGGNIREFNSILDDLLSHLKTNVNTKKASEILLMGDFNINLIKHDSHIPTSEYLDILLSHGQKPLISLPTRITNTSSSLIDHISTNTIENDLDSGIIYSTISDHLATFHISNDTKDRKKFVEKKEKRIFSSTAKEKFNTYLKETDWSRLNEIHEPKLAFDYFLTKIDEYFEASFPIIHNYSPRKNTTAINPFMSKGLLMSRKTRNKLAAKKNKNPTLENIQKFKKYNTIYKSLIRKSKALYYNSKFHDYWGNMRKTWNLINDIIGKKKNTFDYPDYFIENGNLIKGHLDIANGFNDFFSSVGTKIADEINQNRSSSDSCFKDYLKESNSNTFTFPKVTPLLIEEVATNLKAKVSSGLDGISMKLLKEIIPYIKDPLSYLFNLSFTTGYIPPQFKIAIITPIYKLNTYDKTDISNFSNYRPISLLSSFSKLLEKIVVRNMFGFINKYNIFCKHQYGFRPKHNTNHPLLQLTNKIFEALNKKVPEYSLAIFLDIKKAFDCVNFNILLYKLNHYGFRGITNTWFKNYLMDRSQYVSINGTTSGRREITCGVPQGSVLGPVLFLLYINDLPNSTKLFTSLFADDTVFVKSSENLLSLYSEANQELQKASDWFYANKLSLNISKTKSIVFRNNRMPFNPDEYNLQLNGKKIERIGEDCKEKYFKFLGMRIDEFMTWKYHIDHVSSKISVGNSILNRTKNLLPLNVRKTLYCSLIKSQLSYGILFYGNNASGQKIELIQKKCIRNISKEGYISHSDPMFAKLRLLKFKDILRLESLIFMYKYTKNLHPNSLIGMFKFLSNANRTNSFEVSKINSKFLESFPSTFLPKKWNSLPLDLKRTPKLISFKNHIKNKIISEYEIFKCKKRNCYSCNN